MFCCETETRAPWLSAFQHASNWDDVPSNPRLDFFGSTPNKPHLVAEELCGKKNFQ